MKQLVTGGAGFLGSHVVSSLLSAGESVIVLDDLSSGDSANVPDEVELIVGSILDQKLVKDIFSTHQIENVYHLAAYAAEGLSHHIRSHIFQVNIQGSAHLINAAINHNIKCFCFTSSAAVYGYCNHPMSEKDSPAPIDPYGVSKLATEQDLRCARDYFGLNYVVFRPHNIFGERQNTSDKYRNVIGIFMNQIMSRSPLTIFGDGSQTRCFTYVGNISDIVARAPNLLCCHGEIFNLGSEISVSINDLALEISNVLETDLNVNYVGARQEADQVNLLHSKVNGVFNHRDIGLHEGLSRMAKWVKNNWPHRVPNSPMIEVEKKLPQQWVGK